MVIVEGDHFFPQVKRHIRVVKRVVGKVLFYHVAFVASAYNEILYAIVAIEFHDMPYDWSFTDFNQRFRT
jgi:hypothetical protein